jgi:hypothetical protein
MAVLRVVFITGASLRDSPLRPRPHTPSINMPHMQLRSDWLIRRTLPSRPGRLSVALPVHETGNHMDR